MGRKFVRTAGLACALLIVVSCTASTGSRSWRVGTDSNGVPTTFLARYRSSLSLFSTATGARLQDLPLGTTQQLELTGFSRTATGDVLLTVQRFQAVRTTTTAYDPRPDSCGGTIDRIDHRTGKTVTMVTVPPDRTLRSPSLSPDGRVLAYATGPCTGFLDETLVVRDLASGRTSNYRVPGAGVGRVSSGPDHQIAFTARFRSARAGQATSGYFIARDGLDRTFTRAQLRPAMPGCETQAVAYDTAGLLVLRGCPTVTGDALLVQLDSRGRTLWTVAPPGTPNGGTVSVAPNGHTILVATYSPTPGDDVVSVYNGTHLATQHSYRYTLATSVTDATW